MYYYSSNSCRSSGNRCGWFSRNLENSGLMYGLFFGMLTSSVTQSLFSSYVSLDFTLIIYVPLFSQVCLTFVVLPESYGPLVSSSVPSPKSI